LNQSLVVVGLRATKNCEHGQPPKSLLNLTGLPQSPNF
jgi:hypothetical protein